MLILWRRNDNINCDIETTSFWRHNGVIFTSWVRWLAEHLWLVDGFDLLQYSQDHIAYLIRKLNGNYRILRYFCIKLYSFYHKCAHLLTNIFAYKYPCGFKSFLSAYYLWQFICLCIWTILITTGSPMFKNWPCVIKWKIFLYDHCVHDNSWWG